MKSTADSKSNFREDFPGYQGFIPYKSHIIGKTIGASNEAIKSLLTDEPPKETTIKPHQSMDYSHYNRDYYNDNFDRSYPLEEEKIFSNKSKEAKTWISGDKYKIYPQHIPNIQTYIPGLYPSNIHGMGFSRASSYAIKQNYNKGLDCPNNERYKSLNQLTYTNPKTNISLRKEPKRLSQSLDKLYKIYHSKIARIPTVGYTGCANENIFFKPVGYLNYEQILRKEREIRAGPPKASYEYLPEKFQKSLKITTNDTELPYISGYKGFKVGVKSNGYYGANNQDLALQARNQAKFRNKYI